MEEDMKVKIGDKIEGHKVIKYLCHCRHPASDHEVKEKIGSRSRVGDHYETSIIFLKNKGKCTKCKCKGYKKGAVLLENGDILRSDQYFKCDECGEYLNKKKRSEHKYWPVLCNTCVPVYYKKEISEADVDILEIEQILKYLTKNHPGQMKEAADIRIDYDNGSCYGSTIGEEVSIERVLLRRLSTLEENKKKWERFI
jgi:hypothetical protein